MIDSSLASWIVNQLVSIDRHKTAYTSAMETERVRRIQGTSPYNQNCFKIFLLRIRHFSLIY